MIWLVSNGRNGKSATGRPRRREGANLRFGGYSLLKEPPMPVGPGRASGQAAKETTLGAGESSGKIRVTQISNEKTAAEAAPTRLIPALVCPQVAAVDAARCQRAIHSLTLFLIPTGYPP